MNNHKSECVEGTWGWGNVFRQENEEECHYLPVRVIIWLRSYGALFSLPRWWSTSLWLQRTGWVLRLCLVEATCVVSHLLQTRKSTGSGSGLAPCPPLPQLHCDLDQTPPCLSSLWNYGTGLDDGWGSLTFYSRVKSECSDPLSSHSSRLFWKSNLRHLNFPEQDCNPANPSTKPQLLIHHEAGSKAPREHWPRLQTLCLRRECILGNCHFELVQTKEVLCREGELSVIWKDPQYASPLPRPPSLMVLDK